MTPVAGSVGSVLEANSVTKVFGEEVVALDRIDLDVARGEFVALVGPSGCGKSTLLRLFAGLDRPTDGRVIVNGVPVSGPRLDVGVMFQRPVLLPWGSVLQNVMLPVETKSVRVPRARERARELIDTVGLAGFEHHYPAHLSGGMQQRVALARLLMLGSDILLLDEPFGAVDEFTREHLNELLLDIHGQTMSTIVLVTHSVMESVVLADRVVAMTPRPGRVSREVNVPFGRPRSMDVLNDPRFAPKVVDVRASFDPARETS